MTAHRFKKMLAHDRVYDITLHLIAEATVYSLESDFHSVIEQHSNRWSNCPAQSFGSKRVRSQNTSDAAAKLIRLKRMVGENTTAKAEIRLNRSLGGGDTG